MCRLACLTVWTFSCQFFVCTARDARTGAWYDRECTRVEEYNSHLLMPILRRIDACPRSRLCLSFLPVSHVTLYCLQSVSHGVCEPSRSVRVLSHHTCGVNRPTNGRKVSRKTCLLISRHAILIRRSLHCERREHETAIHFSVGHGDRF